MTMMRDWSTLKKLIWLKQTKLYTALETFTGDVVSFVAKKAASIKQLTVNIEPVQDLHGYDNPWPAGCGVNLFSGTYNANGITISGGAYTVNAVNARIAVVPCKANTTYTAKKFETSNRFIVCSASEYPTNGTVLTNYFNDSTAVQKTFTTDANAQYICIGVTTSAEQEEPKMVVCLGSTLPEEWTPYSNICPISGWTGCNVVDTGKNLFDDANANWKTSYYIDANGAEQSNSNYKYSQSFTKVKSGQTYTLQFYKGTTKNAATTIACYDANMAFKTRVNCISNTTETGDMNGTFTVPNSVVFIRISMPRDDITNVQLEEGAVATTYEAFGSSLSISWQSTAETVYGGTLTINEDGTGKLAVDIIACDLANYTGAVAVISNGSNRYFRFDDLPTYPDMKDSSLYNLSDKYKKTVISTSTTNIGIGIGKASSVSHRSVFFRPEKASSYDANTIKTFIRETLGGLTVCYKIPAVEYTLSVEQMNTLVGLNNIWADCGPVEVKVQKGILDKTNGGTTP